MYLVQFGKDPRTVVYEGPLVPHTSIDPGYVMMLVAFGSTARSQLTRPSAKQ
jgi:hypothetical protein